MKIEVIIPTFKRPRKLLDCLAKVDQACALIESRHEVEVSVYFSDKLEFDNSIFIHNYIYTLNKERPNPNLIKYYLLTEPYKASTFWNKCFNRYHADIYFYLNDDVLVDVFCFYNAIQAMDEHFPDTDGLIGLLQSNIPEEQVCKAAFGAIGSTFINRFENRNVFCPEYHAFYLDKELEECATQLNKFYWDKESKLYHRHPAFSNDIIDETHTHNRINLRQDQITNNKRKAKNLTWGITDGITTVSN